MLDEVNPFDYHQGRICANGLVPATEACHVNTCRFQHDAQLRQMWFIILALSCKCRIGLFRGRFL